MNDVEKYSKPAWVLSDVIWCVVGGLGASLIIVAIALAIINL